MRACIHVPTGRLVLACDSSDAATVLANGLAAGFAAEDLAVREITSDDLADLVARNAALDESARPSAERRAARFQAEVDPLAVVWASYMAEGFMDKAADVAARIAAAKAAIRQEVQG